mmetsp:Transcript_16737/g.25796  ORF Transcript_16737/g.25796 Transcript_16737/m.25796 type:complete len:172 (-) Transcript_16737:253-768(-)
MGLNKVRHGPLPPNSTSLTKTEDFQDTPDKSAKSAMASAHESTAKKTIEMNVDLNTKLPLPLLSHKSPGFGKRSRSILVGASNMSPSKGSQGNPNASGRSSILLPPLSNLRHLNTIKIVENEGTNSLIRSPSLRQISDEEEPMESTDGIVKKGSGVKQATRNLYAKQIKFS